MIEHRKRFLKQLSKRLNLFSPLLLILFSISFGPVSKAEPIYHEIYYPDGSGPFPAVIALHTSGGFRSISHLFQRYVDDGFAVYVPDFFKRHGITTRNKWETFSTYRKNVEKELSEIVQLMKNNPRIEKKNVFAVGFSNGGFWVCYLTGNSEVNAGVSHYGVWKANWGRKITNPYPIKYFSKSSSPILSLHGADDGTQRMNFVQKAWDEVRNRRGRLETHVYSGADHAWDRKYSPRWEYNEEVDKDSHKRTIEFFKKHLK